MTIKLGGQEFTEDQVIAAIASSNDADHNHSHISAFASVEEMSGVLQAVLHRLAALEDRLPITHSGYGVSSEIKNGYTCYRVQTLNHHGEVIVVKFEIPLVDNSASSNNTY